MGPFESKDSEKTFSLLIKMTKFIVAASKGDYNYDEVYNTIIDLTLKNFKMRCGVPDLGLYLITIGI